MAQITVTAETRTFILNTVELTLTLRLIGEILVLHSEFKTELTLSSTMLPIFSANSKLI